jgi:hypothetical protein
LIVRRQEPHLIEQRHHVTRAIRTKQHGNTFHALAVHPQSAARRAGLDRFPIKQETLKH